MAFRKVLALALLSLAASAPAPQVLTQLHTVAHAPQVVRTIQAAPVVQTVRAVPAAVSHSNHHTSITHETPAVNVVRTVSAQPLVHSLAAQPVLHSLAHPTVVRTVAHQPVVQHVEHVEAAPVSVVRQVPTANYIQPQVEEVEVEVEEAKPNYRFGYSVADTVSGDAKTREETRDGDKVTGSYTVADPDGRIRKVTYTADKEHGFQATVTYDGRSGPVAIPIDPPATTVSAAAAPAVIDDEPAAIIVAARNRDEEVAVEAEEEPEVQRTPAVTPTLVQAIPPAAFFAHPTVVRTTAAADPHAVHNIHTAAVPQASFIRLANGQTFASTPFGLRAVPVNAPLVHHLPVGAQLVHA